VLRRRAAEPSRVVDRNGSGACHRGPRFTIARPGTDDRPAPLTKRGRTLRTCASRTQPRFTDDVPVRTRMPPLTREHPSRGRAVRNTDKRPASPTAGRSAWLPRMRRHRSPAERSDPPRGGQRVVRSDSHNGTTAQRGRATLGRTRCTPSRRASEGGPQPHAGRPPPRNVSPQDRARSGLPGGRGDAGRSESGMSGTIDTSDTNFFLPGLDIHVECAAMKQSSTTRTNRKARAAACRYGIVVVILHQRDRDVSAASTASDSRPPDTGSSEPSARRSVGEGNSSAVAVRVEPASRSTGLRSSAAGIRCPWRSSFSSSSVTGNAPRSLRTRLPRSASGSLPN